MNDMCYYDLAVARHAGCCPLGSGQAFAVLVNIICIIGCFVTSQTGFDYQYVVDAVKVCHAQDSCRRLVSRVHPLLNMHRCIDKSSFLQVPPMFREAGGGHHADLTP